MTTTPPDSSSAAAGLVAVPATQVHARIRANEIAVLIGRFAPVDRRHEQALRSALAAWRQVVVVIVAAFQAPSPRNPFTWQQRADMIRLCLSDEENRRLKVVPVRDHHRDDRWAEEVARGVHRQAPDAGDKQFTVVHAAYDDPGDYRYDCPRVLPRWGQQPMALPPSDSAASDGATIRSVLLSVDGEARAAALAFLEDAVPTAVRHYLSAWWESPVRARLAQENEWIKEYRKRWPVEQTMTVDALVICSDHVLLIERGEGAGAGLYALPGGFLEKDERFYEGAKRELREETGLGYVGDGLDVAFVRAEVFDRPDRSLRARIVTVAHLFDLKSTPLPDVQGRDDARHALWLPLARLAAMEERFFEDHFQIIDHFLQLTRP